MFFLLRHINKNKKIQFSTALLDGTVVKLGFGIDGVTPGTVLVPIWVTTVILRQIGLGMRPGVDSGESNADQ